MGDLLLVLLFLKPRPARTGWPVTGWVLFAAALAWGVRFAMKRGRLRPGAEALASALTGVVAGLALVWGAQVILTGISVFASDASVRGTEDSLARMRASLVGLTHVGVFAGTVVATVALGWRAGARRPRRRCWLPSGRPSSSGRSATRLAEGRWVDSRRTEASRRPSSPA